MEGALATHFLIIKQVERKDLERKEEKYYKGGGGTKDIFLHNTKYDFFAICFSEHQSVIY